MWLFGTPKFKRFPDDLGEHKAKLYTGLCGYAATSPNQPGGLRAPRTMARPQQKGELTDY
jgi:hypothetical protein